MIRRVYEEEQEMKEWKIKLGVKRMMGDKEVIVKREMKEEKGKVKKKVEKQPVGEARCGMEAKKSEWKAAPGRRGRRFVSS